MTVAAAPPDHRLEEARAIRIEDEATRRGIKLRGGNERSGPCPACGGTDRFSINVKKQLWNCRGCAAGGDVIALVQHIDGSDFMEAVATLVGAAERTGCSIPNRCAATSKQIYQDAKKPKEELPNGKQNLALALWRAAVDPRGTLVEQYLKFRALELPDEAANEAIRFHPDCPFGPGKRYPAMVCLVRIIVTNEPQAIHRTALAPDGTSIKRNGKTHRMSLGPITGGAIKIDPDEDVTHGLCIGEGVETCLSGRQMGLRPVWSAVSKSGVENFPLLAGVDGFHLFKENDLNGASTKAVESCARRWFDAGRDVLIVEPDIGNDLNDELREAAR